MKFSSQPINRFFSHPDSPLGKIVSKAASIKALNQCFEATLPPELLSQCRLGQYENGIITLFTDSAALATRLRFFVPELLSQLRQLEDFRGLVSIQVKIAMYIPPPTPSVPPQHEPITPLPAEQSEMLMQLAKGLDKTDPASEKLAKSLEKLAKRGEK